MPKEENLKTTEIRQQLFETFTTLTADMSDKELGESFKILIGEDHPEVSKLPRQEKMQLVKDGLDDLSRGAVVELLYGFVAKLNRFLK